MPRHLILPALLPLFVGSCAYNLTPERMFYPSTWPPLRVVNSRGCEDFVGVYNAKGENAQLSPNSVNGPKLLNILGLPGSRDTAYVSVQSMDDGGALQMVALNSAREPIPVAGISEPIGCSSGDLVRNFTSAGYADGSSHKGETSVTLSLTANGSLVAHVVGISQTDDLLSHATKNYDVLYRFARSQ